MIKHHGSQFGLSGGDPVDSLMNARANAHQERVMANIHENLDVTKGTHGTATKTGVPPNVVLPASEHGGFQAFPDMSDSSRAYYTAPRKDGRGLDTSREGWKWAHQAQMNRPASATKARPMVLHVQPDDVSDVDVDKNLNNYGKDQQLTASKLNVTDVEWMPPPEYNIGVQGTLPNENWNKYPGATLPRYGDNNFTELQPTRYNSAKSGFNAPRVNEEQFAPIKPVEGQLEMFDRPPSWNREGRKADI